MTHETNWNALHSPNVNPANAVRDHSHNDIVSNRAKARKLWRMLSRSLSAPEVVTGR